MDFQDLDIHSAHVAIRTSSLLEEAEEERLARRVERPVVVHSRDDGTVARDGLRARVGHGLMALAAAIEGRRRDACAQCSSEGSEAA
jgi:hypothetical protein